MAFEGHLKPTGVKQQEKNDLDFASIIGSYDLLLSTGAEDVALLFNERTL